MEKLLQTGFDRRILRKMANRHSYYTKETLWSRQLFHRTDIVRESVNLRTIDRKLTLNLKVIFSSFTDIFFLMYVTKIFYLFLFSRKTFGSVLRYSSQWLRLYVLSSKGANQLQLICKNFGKHPRKLLARNPILLKLWSSNVFQ